MYRKFILSASVMMALASTAVFADDSDLNPEPDQAGSQQQMQRDDSADQQSGEHQSLDQNGQALSEEEQNVYQQDMDEYEHEQAELQSGSEPQSDILRKEVENDKARIQEELKNGKNVEAQDDKERLQRDEKAMQEQRQREYTKEKELPEFEQPHSPDATEDQRYQGEQNPAPSPQQQLSENEHSEPDQYTAPQHYPPSHAQPLQEQTPTPSDTYVW